MHGTNLEESRRTGTGGPLNEYAVRVGWIMMSVLVVSSRLILWW